VLVTCIMYVVTLRKLSLRCFPSYFDLINILSCFKTPVVSAYSHSVPWHEHRVTRIINGWCRIVKTGVKTEQNQMLTNCQRSFAVRLTRKVLELIMPVFHWQFDLSCSKHFLKCFFTCDLRVKHLSHKPQMNCFTSVCTV